MRTVIVSKPLPQSAPATTALVKVSLRRTLCHPRCWYAAIWACCSSQISDAMTPWLRAGLSAVHASRTAKKSRWTCARNTFSSKAGSCAWTVATPESLPSTPSLSVLGAHGPRHHLPVPPAARAMQRDVRRREVTLAGGRLTFGQPLCQLPEPIDESD